MCKKLMFLISLVSVLALASSVSAQDYEWTGAYPWSVLWLSGQNWDPVAPFLGPGPDDQANLVGPPMCVSDYDVDVGQLRGPAEDGGEQELLIVSGNFLVGEWRESDMQGKGMVTVINDANVVVNDDMRVANDGTLVLDVSGDATFDVDGGLRAGDNGGASIELYVADSAVVSIGGNFHIGEDGGGIVEVSGGLFEVDEDVTFELRRSTSDVTLTITGGEMNVGGDLSGDRDNGDDAQNAATVNISGGLLSVGGGLILPDHEDGHGFLNMTGGELIVDELEIGRGEESLQNLDGGVIDAGGLNDEGNFWMNITGGVMILDDDVTADIEDDVIAQKITAYGKPSRGDVMIDFDTVNPGRTTVWAEAHFDRAWAPDPAHKATGVASRDLVMSWNPGDGAINHHVFFSDDESDVAAKSLAAYKGDTAVCEYVPGDLQLGQTYYWMIVEEQAGAVFVDGWVWQFTVEESRALDDMESYTTNPNYIFDVWKDGCGDAEGLGGNGTGSCVDLTVANQHSGAQAMLYYYECFRDLYKERDANYAMATQTFDPPQNLLASGELALVLWFYGAADNGSTEMLVAVNDGASEALHAYGTYGDDPEDIKKEEWIDWNIALADLAMDVDLTNVVSLSIIFGDYVNGLEEEDVEGFVLFDDIALHPARCVPRYITDIVDLNDDCVTDWGDVGVIAGNWLEEWR